MNEGVDTMTKGEATIAYELQPYRLVAPNLPTSHTFQMDGELSIHANWSGANEIFGAC